MTKGKDKTPQPLFCLGGRDLEMAEIARLLRTTLGDDAVADRGLGWDQAKASAYRSEVGATLDAGREVVLVELENDLPAKLQEQVLVIDHHGPLAGANQPTAIEQVFSKLGLRPKAWTRRFALVAANDRGWIPELRAIGASDGEILAIREEDRRAQGITAAEDRAGARAFERPARLEAPPLLVFRLPHNKIATVFDRLALATPAGDTIADALAVSPSEINFSGGGDIAKALTRAYPQGWYGGALPERGFWGVGPPLPAEVVVIDKIRQAVRRR